jgi:hypothetical protein
MYGILGIVGIAIIFLLVCLRGFQGALKQSQNCGVVLGKLNRKGVVELPRSKEEPINSLDVARAVHARH